MEPSEEPVVLPVLPKPTRPLNASPVPRAAVVAVAGAGERAGGVDRGVLPTELAARMENASDCDALLAHGGSTGADWLWLACSWLFCCAIDCFEVLFVADVDHRSLNASDIAQGCAHKSKM